MLWNRLLEYLRTLKAPLVVAYSGGVDSTLLAYASHCAGGVKAVTVDSPFLSRRCLQRARDVASQLELAYEVVQIDTLSHQNIITNDSERCYWCKRLVFDAIRDKVSDQAVIMDGTNADDDEARPGIRAAAEAGVLSPLRQLGFTKDMIRAKARGFGFMNWQTPSESCLATRIRTGQAIEMATLKAIEAMEDHFLKKGLATLRARVDNLMITVEYPSNDKDIVDDCRKSALELIKEFGFKGMTFREWT